MTEGRKKGDSDRRKKGGSEEEKIETSLYNNYIFRYLHSYDDQSNSFCDIEMKWKKKKTNGIEKKKY